MDRLEASHTAYCLQNQTHSRHHHLQCEKDRLTTKWSVQSTIRNETSS